MTCSGNPPCDIVWYARCTPKYSHKQLCNPALRGQDSNPALKGSRISLSLNLPTWFESQTDPK
jgi:hypothetical protein